MARSTHAVVLWLTAAVLAAAVAATTAALAGGRPATRTDVEILEIPRAPARESRPVVPVIEAPARNAPPQPRGKPLVEP
jgi:hypothetical protein